MSCPVDLENRDGRLFDSRDTHHESAISMVAFGGRFLVSPQGD